ncbi:MAG: hypothetical protein GY801_19870, partial [bacterium]|nr:hypothetical protein [bacterium]
AEDIVKRWKPGIEDKTLVLIGRITAGVVIVLAILWSPYCGKFVSIFEAINKIPMMFAPAITCVLLLGVFWKRGTKEAAISTFSFSLTLFWRDVPSLLTASFAFDNFLYRRLSLFCNDFIDASFSLISGLLIS